MTQTPEPAPADHSRLLTPADVRALADRLDIRPTKTLGQNFVIDHGTVRRIVRVAGVTDDDVVVEVGPGLGSLTLALLPHVRHVTAIEIDPVLGKALPDTVADHAPDLADRLTVVLDDAMRVAELPGPEPTALVANLPYNVSVPVLLHLLELLPSLRRVLVMVQSEVADHHRRPRQPCLRSPLRQDRLVRRRTTRGHHRAQCFLARTQRRLGAGGAGPSTRPQDQDLP